MKKKMFFCFAILTLLFKTDVYAARCEIVMDADSGRVLHEVNIEEKRLIASTTKIMTALVVLNNSNMDAVVTVGDEVLKAYGSAIYIKPEEKLTVRDLLYGLMMRSGNDAALVLAKFVGGSTEGFATLMNETALQIGMKNTIFKNPHGLDEETQNYSTVYDMALLMREAMKNEEFKKVTGEQKYTLKTNFNTYEWYNKNRLLTEYKYATGGKIGYTTKSGHTFVSSATKDKKNLIIATFVDADRFNTHKVLYEKYFERYKRYKLIDKNDLRIDYKKGYKIFTTESFYMLLNDDEKDRVKREVVLYSDVEASENATKIGTLSIELDGKTYKKLGIFASKHAKNTNSIWDKIRKMFLW